MKKFIKEVISLSLIIVLLFSTAIPAYTCTIFNASNMSKVLVGNNEDYTDTATKIWFVPAENGNFGKVCFGFDFTYPQGGMNDQGLFFDWYASGELKPCPVIPGQMLPGDIILEKTPSIDELMLFYKNNKNMNDMLLETCTTVDDALSLYQKYYEPCFGYAQLMVVDKSGSSAVLTWDWDNNELKVVRNTAGEYQVIGVGTEAVKHDLQNGNRTISSGNFRTLLEDASIDITRYSNIYDLKTGTVEVFMMRDFKRSVKFKLTNELKKGDANYSLDEFFTEKLNQKRLYLFGISVAVCIAVIFAILLYVKRKRK